MSLPICPHCGQSVLDDDVDECPFCGESMSGKPIGKKPAPVKPSPAPKAAKPAKAETKPETPVPAKAKSKPTEPVASADQPFAVDHAALTNAVALKPSPSPGRTYKVICPMCETPGYTSTKAAGREVKCANPKCLVPIFTCPEPPPAPVEEAPPEPAGMSTAQLGLISVVALAAIGWGIWFFVLKKEDPTPSPQDPPPGVADNSNDQVKTTEPEVTTDGPQKITPQVKAGPDLAELRPRAVEKMVETSQVLAVRGPTRPLPLRAHWLALAYAELGDMKNAEAQVEQLANIAANEPHYRVRPLVVIGWTLRAREESPQEAADTALEFAKNEPASLQDSWLEAVSLSALLAATGRAEEAVPLMGRKLGAPVDQELWADVMAVSLERTYNLETRERTRPLATPASPAWSGVVWQLVFHDASQEALDWVNRAPDTRTRAESLIAWADAVVARAIAEEQDANLADLEPAIQSLPEPWPLLVRARAEARMGQRWAMAGDDAQAQAILKKAEAALALLPKSEPLPVPDLEGIYRAKFSNANMGQGIAVAAFEVARLQASLNQTDAAWKSIEQGLVALRSESLPLAATKKMQADVRSNGAFLQAELQTALALSTEDAARQAFQEYQKKVNEFARRASARLELQADLLSHAARWKLADKVAAEILAIPEGEGGDSYLETELPWVVLAELKGQSTELAKGIDDKLKARRQAKPKGLALIEDAARAMEGREIAKVIESLGRGTRENSSIPESVRKRWLLRLATQQVVKGQTENMLSFLLGLFNVDPFLGEDAAELIVALAVRSGQGELVWAELEQRSWLPTQRMAGYLGFVAAVDPKAEEEKN
jgi:hypothetical protein